jgi:hypothetical protein
VLVIYQQIQFIQSTDPGYNKDNVIRFDSEGALQGNEDNFIEALKKIPGVVNASFTFNNMVGRIMATMLFRGKEKTLTPMCISRVLVQDTISLKQWACI